MTAFQLSPISGDYVVGKGRLLIKVSGATQFQEIGDVEAMSISQDNTVLERFTNQTGTRTKADSRITQQNANLSFTMVQATARNLALAMMSDKNTLTQALGTTQLGTLTSLQVGDIIDTGKLNINVQSFTDHATALESVGRRYELQARQRDPAPQGRGAAERRHLRHAQGQLPGDHGLDQAAARGSRPEPEPERRAGVHQPSTPTACRSRSTPSGASSSRPTATST
jgi:hypothetical protein